MALRASLKRRSRSETAPASNNTPLNHALNYPLATRQLPEQLPESNASLALRYRRYFQ